MLSTGRCGSVTFAKAASHLTNFTSAHESRRRIAGPDRIRYPDQHVESDNRLSWMLGHLDAEYGDDAFYVHLRRDPEATARSYLGRWDNGYRGGIILAFAHGILQTPDEWPEESRLDVCRFYVDTVDRNIEAFMKGRPHVAQVRLESGAADFEALWHAIGGRGDLDAALAEWDVRHNASEVT